MIVMERVGEIAIDVDDVRCGLVADPGTIGLTDGARTRNDHEIGVAPWHNCR